MINLILWSYWLYADFGFILFGPLNPDPDFWIIRSGLRFKLAGPELWICIIFAILNPATFFRLRLEKYNFLRKKKLYDKLCFSLNCIPLDPDPWTHMNVDPTGSRSTSLNKRLWFTIHNPGVDFDFDRRKRAGWETAFTPYISRLFILYLYKREAVLR